MMVLQIQENPIFLAEGALLRTAWGIFVSSFIPQRPSGCPESEKTVGDIPFVFSGYQPQDFDLEFRV